MKALRSLETGKKIGAEEIEPKRMTQRLVTPQPERLNYIRFAFRQGLTVREVARMTSMDPWFLYHIKEVTDTIAKIGEQSIDESVTGIVTKSQADGCLGRAYRRGVGVPTHEGVAQRARPAASSSVSSPCSSWSIPARPSSRA